MTDAFGRNIDYIRLSITDRCSLRCTYCMPENGVQWLPHESILRYEDLLRLCRIFISLGISKFKITGGEPLVRKGLSSFVNELHALKGVESITLTTNGVDLTSQLSDLLNAGINGINLSLDTLDRTRFAERTRRDCLPNVLEGLDAALAVPDLNLKINCVSMSGCEDDWIALAKLARDQKLTVRFIELMPIGMGQGNVPCTETQVSEVLEKEFGKLEPYDTPLGNGPAHYFSLDGFRGKIGFISAVSHGFCSSCNRVRLTASGYLKTCLQYDTGADLAGLLAQSDEVIREAVIDAIHRKPESHQFASRYVRNGEKHIMSQIGG